jgi:anaerobic magnesium-protoporphyrin IX monomethyl ester cyclase
MFMTTATKTNRKILIIDPPFQRLYKPTYSSTIYPLALGYLASAVRDNTDWGVVTYNADFCKESETFQLTDLVSGFDDYQSALNDMSHPVWQEIKEYIQKYRPNVVGVSTKTQNYIAACNIARISKLIDKNIITVLGGAHPSMVGEGALECEAIDVAVIGEGEITLVELLNAIDSDCGFHEVYGIVYRMGVDVIKTQPRAFIENLDVLGYPYTYAATTLKDFHLYPKEAFKYVFAIRGCPYGCTFCGSKNIWSRKVRYRSPENVAYEIKLLYDQGINPVHFHDDTFGISREYIFNLCREIHKNCPKLFWSCEIHANLVDEEVISTMRRSGCYFIQMGVESGNNAILDKIKKKITVEKCERAADIIMREGIVLQLFFMVGFPDETFDSIEDTKKAMLRINPDQIIYSIFTPYPGTALFDQLKFTGVIGDSFDVSLYNHQSPNNHFSVAIPKDEFRRVASEIERIVDGFNNSMDCRRSIRMYVTYGKPIRLMSISPDVAYTCLGFDSKNKEAAVAWALSENATSKTVLCINHIQIQGTVVDLGGGVIQIEVPPAIFEVPGVYPVYLMDTVTMIRSNELTFTVLDSPAEPDARQLVEPDNLDVGIWGRVRRFFSAM